MRVDFRALTSVRSIKVLSRGAWRRALAPPHTYSRETVPQAGPPNGLIPLPLPQDDYSAAASTRHRRCSTVLLEQVL